MRFLQGVQKYNASYLRLTKALDGDYTINEPKTKIGK